MNVIFTQDGVLIPPHLNHTLKSYYYNTDTKIFCIDENGLIIDHFPRNNHYITNIDDSYCRNVIDTIKDDLYCDAHNKKLTFTYTYHGFFNFLVSPIFYENKLKGALIAGPICYSQKELDKGRNDLLLSASSKNKEKIENLLANTVVKVPPKSFYMSQLLHHLLEKSIYIGPNTSRGIETKEFITQKDMENKASKSKASNTVSKISEMVLNNKEEEALVLYRKTLMLGDFFLDNSEDNLNNLKGEILTLGALISHNLIKSGCDSPLVTRTKAAFFHRILNSNSYQCLFQCGEAIIQNFSDILRKKSYIGKSKPVKDSIIYIQNNFKKKILIEDICKSIFLSKAYLSTLFKEETNVTIINYIKEYRIKHSKYLLLNTNLSILEIALESGFESQNYFSSVFRTEEKMTPRQYRNKKSHDESHMIGA